MSNPITSLTKKNGPFGWGHCWSSWYQYFSANFNVLTLVASCVGVTSLIIAAKGNVWSQILMILFSVLYGIISWQFHYWGEMMTYLGMTIRWQSGQRSHGSGIVREWKRSWDSATDEKTYIFLLGYQRYRYHHNIFQNFGCIGNTEYHIQHNFYYDKFFSSVTDNAALLLLCSRICRKWYCTDRTLDYGNHEGSVLLFSDDYFYNIFLLWCIWFH